MSRYMADETPDALLRHKESVRVLRSKGLAVLATEVMLTHKGESILLTVFGTNDRTVEEAITLAEPSGRPPLTIAEKFLASRGSGFGD